MKEILSVEEVCELLQCEPYSLGEAVRSGRLPGIKYGRSWVFPSEALIKVLNEQALKHVEQGGDRPTGIPVVIVKPEDRRVGRRGPRINFTNLTK